jgi:hypothetical protein
MDAKNRLMPFAKFVVPMGAVIDACASAPSSNRAGGEAPAEGGSGTQAVSVSLAVGSNNTNPTSVGSMGDVLYADVAADNVDTVNGYPTREVRVATRVVGTTGAVGNNSLQFTLSPGRR